MKKLIKLKSWFHAILKQIRILMKEYWLCIYLLILVIPYIFEKLFQIFGWNWFENITGSDWLMYCGAMSGAYATIVAVVYSIRDNHEKQEMPYLHAFLEMLRFTVNDKHEFNPKGNQIFSKERGFYTENVAYGRLTITNVGLGAAINTNIKSNSQLEINIKTTNVLPSKMSESVEFILFYDLEDNTLPSEYKTPKLYYYCDSILGNKYMLIMKLNLFVTEYAGDVDFMIENQCFTKI